MKKKFIWLGLTMLMVAAMLLTSCGTSTTTPTTTTKTTVTSTTTTTSAAVSSTLTVANGSTVKSYTLADLQALTPVTGKGGKMGKGGTITGPDSYQGVALTVLLNAVGGLTAGQSVKTTATDGYSTTLTYDQIINGNLNTYDATGNPVTPAIKPVLVVVYSKNGTLLDSATGPFEIGLLSDQGVISDGNVWAKLLKQIDITSAGTTSSTTTMSTTTTTHTTTTAVVTTTTTTAVPTTPVILTVVNGAQQTTFSLAQLQQIPPVIGTTGSIGKTNTVSGPDQYIGVQLKDLLTAVGGFTSTNSVKITAVDGYSKTLTYAQVMNGTGTTVVDNTGATVTPITPPMPFLAYTKNGAALDSTTGPLQLGFFTSPTQYTMSSMWVKSIVKIEIIAAQ
jgi:DMSO/TMAO reductase YedYZ molybdopterin-dependent catalytic subunit